MFPVSRLAPFAAFHGGPVASLVFELVWQRSFSGVRLAGVFLRFQPSPVVSRQRSRGGAAFCGGWEAGRSVVLGWDPSDLGLDP